MKKGFGAAAVLLLVAVALVHFFNSKAPAPAIVAPATLDSAASQSGIAPGASLVASANVGSNLPATMTPQPQTPPGSIAAKDGQGVSDAISPTQIRPETVLQNVGRMVHQYGEMFGGNPVGTNPEITSQLSGDNPKHINFITTQAGMRINSDGELVDAWGTPYFFHQISGTEMEIHSAGPDKIMWTSDDLVIK
jgi:hypothetical protein